MRPSVVRSRQRCPRLGRKWSRRFLHLWSWCGLQIFKSAWPGPHLQSASGKFWRFFFRSRRSRTTDAQWSLFSSKSQTFGLGQTILGRKILGHFGVFSADLSAPILVQWVPCPCFSLINHYFYKKLSFKVSKSQIFIIKSNFKSRAGYNSACTVLWSQILLG